MRLPSDQDWVWEDLKCRTEDQYDGLVVWRNYRQGLWFTVILQVRDDEGLKLIDGLGNGKQEMDLRDVLEAEQKDLVTD